MRAMILSIGKHSRMVDIEGEISIGILQSGEVGRTGVDVPDGVGVDDVAIGVVAPDAEADGILI